MSDDYQTTSKSLANRFLTQAERDLFNLLRNGPRRYSEIIRFLKDREISESKSNDLLNKNVEENRLFRIKKGTQVFYRINDFPLNVKALLILLDHNIKEKELGMLNMPVEKEGESASETFARLAYNYLYQIPKEKQELAFLQAFKGNIIRLFPKLDLRKICQLTVSEISASASGNQFLLNFLEGLKAALD